MIILLTLLAYILVLVFVLFIIIYAYFLYSYQYWSRKKFPYLKPKFPKGNCPRFWTIIKGYPVDLLDSCYEKIKKTEWKFCGFFTVHRPTLLVVDPEYIRDILIKDFHHFVDRGFYYKKGDDISANLFLVDETQWKNIRTKLTPTFTSGKMKMMFPLIVEASNQMVTFLEGLSDQKKDIDIKECLTMFTTDVIVSCAYGLESNCFTDKNHQFRSVGKSIFNYHSFINNVKVTMMNYAPELALIFKMRSTKRNVAQFFSKIIESTIKYRKENNVTRDDFLQLMINLVDSTKNSDTPFTFEQLVSQVNIFFIAGFETSSSTMNFALYELAKNIEFQEKLRSEILLTLKNNGGILTYEAINDMKYLQQIIDETLRLYPILSCIQRKCIKDYKLKDTNNVIEKGIQIVIPVINIHRDPEYYPDPLKFDPERFSPENKDNITPYTYLPFGDGPRNCIGLRFGLMQTKTGLIQILRKFRLKISPSTKLPLDINREHFLLQPLETLYLQAEKL